LELCYSTRSKAITQTLRPYLELLELSASKNRTMQSLFDEDMKVHITPNSTTKISIHFIVAIKFKRFCFEILQICAESDPSLFLELVSYLLKYLKETPLVVEGNVNLIRAIVSTAYPSQVFILFSFSIFFHFFFYSFYFFVKFESFSM
jgi:hypothetical protein